MRGSTGTRGRVAWGGAGLKGHRRGSAYVSPKHANFVQVDEGGSADEVAALIAEVAALVAERTGVVLQLELHRVGFPAVEASG